MMSTSNGRREQVSVPVEVPERSGGTSTDTPRPDPEVLEKAKRRQFSAEYKLGIVEEANACQEPGQIAALLRREGLYSSLLSEWRRARREGSLKALAKPRGPKGRGRDPVTDLGAQETTTVTQVTNLGTRIRIQTKQDLVWRVGTVTALTVDTLMLASNWTPLLRCTPSDATRCTLDVIECTRGWHRSVPSAPHVWNAGTG